MKYSDAHVALWEAHVTIDRLIWIAGALTDIESSDLAQFWEDTDFDRVPPELKVDTHEAWDNSVFAEHLSDSGIFGLLANVSTPIPRKNGDGTCSIGTWSSRYTHWIYAETLEELRTKAIAWAGAARKEGGEAKAA